MKIEMFVLAILVAWFVLGCQDNGFPISTDVSFDGTRSNNASEMKVAVFPLFIGSRWTYAVYDSIKKSADTLTVEIVDSTQLSNGTWATVWEHRFTRWVDTQFVARSGDTVLYYENRNVRSLFRIIIFPLEVGRRWDTYPPGTMTVTDVEQVTVPVNVVKDAYRLEQHPNIGNFYGGVTFWFVTDIGMVRMQQKWFDTMAGDRQNVVSELIAYNISG